MRVHTDEVICVAASRQSLGLKKMGVQPFGTAIDQLSATTSFTQGKLLLALWFNDGEDQGDDEGRGNGYDEYPLPQRAAVTSGYHPTVFMFGGFP